MSCMWDENEILFKINIQKCVLNTPPGINGDLYYKLFDFWCEFETNLINRDPIFKKTIDDMLEVCGGYNDNIRFADTSNGKDIEHYEYLKSRGCCGFFDDQITINGRTYLYGCNYGH